MKETVKELLLCLAFIIIVILVTWGLMSLAGTNPPNELDPPDPTTTIEVVTSEPVNGMRTYTITDGHRVTYCVKWGGGGALQCDFQEISP